MGFAFDSGFALDCWAFRALGSDFALKTSRALRTLGFGIDIESPDQIISSQKRGL